jgi:hypothetical protein
MADSTFSAIGSRFKALPRNQQLGILFGIPVVVAITAEGPRRAWLRPDDSRFLEA